MKPNFAQGHQQNTSLASGFAVCKGEICEDTENSTERIYKVTVKFMTCSMGNKISVSRMVASGRVG